MVTCIFQSRAVKGCHCSELKVMLNVKGLSKTKGNPNSHYNLKNTLPKLKIKLKLCAKEEYLNLIIGTFPSYIP